IGEAADRHRGEMVRSGAVAELTGSIIPPAAGAAVGNERARVRKAASNGHGASKTVDGHRREPIIYGSAVAELAGAVQTPAAGETAGQNRAGVNTPGSDGYGVGEAEDGRRGAPICRRAVTELSLTVVAP